MYNPRPMRLLLSLCILLAGCATAPTGAISNVQEPLLRTTRLVAVTYSDDASIVAVRKVDRGCVAEIVDPVARRTVRSIVLPTCPVKLKALSPTQILAIGPRSRWLNPVTGEISEAGRLVDAISSTIFLERDGDRLAWNREGRKIDLSGLLAGARLLRLSDAVLALEHAAGGDRIIEVHADGSRRTVFDADGGTIHSFDIDPKEKDIVVSSKRAGGFDVAIVSLSTGKPNWVWPEPADEVDVTWAPRGNKVTYEVRAFGGTILRTVHVPTAAQLSIDLGESEVEALAWEPKAERVSLVLSQPAASSRLETVRYGGEERQVVLESARRLDSVTDRLMTGRPAILFPPRELRYGVRYPVVVVRTRSVFAWSDLVAALAARGDVAVVVIDTQQDTVESLATVERIAWADSERRFLISAVPLGESRVAGVNYIVGENSYAAAGDGVMMEAVEDFESKAYRKVSDSIDGRAK